MVHLLGSTILLLTSSVKLVPTSDPLAQAALDIHRRYPGRTATRFGGKVGGIGVDGVYIYPASVPTLTP